MKNLKKGKWKVNTKPDSLIINFFDLTEKISNDKILILMQGIAKQINSNNIVNHRVLFENNGVKLYFDITIDSNGNYGLLFTGTN